MIQSYYLLSQSIIWPEYAPPTIRFGWNMENLISFGQEGYTQCLLFVPGSHKRGLAGEDILGCLSLVLQIPDETHTLGLKIVKLSLAKWPKAHFILLGFSRSSPLPHWWLSPYCCNFPTTVLGTLATCKIKLQLY